MITVSGVTKKYAAVWRSTTCSSRWRQAWSAAGSLDLAAVGSTRRASGTGSLSTPRRGRRGSSTPRACTPRRRARDHLHAATAVSGISARCVAEGAGRGGSHDRGGSASQRLLARNETAPGARRGAGSTSAFPCCSPWDGQGLPPKWYAVTFGLYGFVLGALVALLRPPEPAVAAVTPGQAPSHEIGVPLPPATRPSNQALEEEWSERMRQLRER